MSGSGTGERALSAAEYLLGVAELGVIAVALGFAARTLRRAALPGWSGPAAWVADAVATISLAVVLGEVLGTFEAFSTLGLLVGSVGLAAVSVPVARRLIRRRAADPAQERGDAPTAARPSRTALLGVAAVVAVIVAGWLVPTISALTGGMGRADSLWYHMPLSLRFAETGSTGDLFFFDPIFFAHFYPANTELLHAVGLLAFDRDFLSPLVNLGFLAMGLLAGWAIGRPYGVGPQAMLGVGVVLGAETMVSFHAGEALNDVAGVAFLLGAVALLVNGRARLNPSSGEREGLLVPAVAFAGAAAGLAAGTKLSLLAPVALLTFAIPYVADRGRRLVSTAAWSLPMLATGGYWYLRNLLQTGNPIPFTSFGPLGLPSPERGFELRPGFSVFHYRGEPSIWREWFAPAFAEELGVLWPVILIALAAVCGYAVWRARDRLTRALALVVLLTAVAYLFTPLTAGGEEGEPIAFEWNIRYLTPAIAIALALLPCLPALRRTPQRRLWSLAGLGVLALATTLSIEQWGDAFANRAGAAILGVCVFACFAFAILAHERGWLRSRRVSVWLAVAAAWVVAGGYLVQERYLDGRYENRGEDLKLAEALRWAQDIRDSRIAVSGVRGVYNQYVLAGADLSNDVQWVGRPSEHDGFERVASCSEWRSALDAGGYDYAVTLYDPYYPGELTDTKEGLWTRTAPGARQVLRNGPVSVFELPDGVSSEGCEGLPELESAELNGDSVNLAPLANQP